MFWHARIRTYILVVLMGALCACGPQDYQKPIQQFQDASAVVSASAKTFLENVNTTEQNALVE